MTRPAISWEPLSYHIGRDGVAATAWVGDELLVGRTVGATATSSEPGFVPSVPLPTQISKDPEVIGTNFALALVFAAIFGFTSTLFNSTLKTKNAEIVADARRRWPRQGREAQRLDSWASWSRAKAAISRPAMVQATGVRACPRGAGGGWSR